MEVKAADAGPMDTDKKEAEAGAEAGADAAPPATAEGEEGAATEGQPKVRGLEVGESRRGHVFP